MAAEREHEKQELARVKNFCSSLLKTLAPLFCMSTRKLLV
jgi:hypothetical protein